MSDEGLLTDVVPFTHGIGTWPGDGREAAFCRYHGLIAAAPAGVSDFVQTRWVHHLTHDCIIPTLENRSASVHDADGNLIGYQISSDLWREIRAALRRGEQQPAASGEVDRG